MAANKKAKKPLMAAVSSAVIAYITAVEREQALAAAPVCETRPPQPPISLWSIAGRQANMEMRRMWQMRLAR